MKLPTTLSLLALLHRALASSSSPPTHILTNPSSPAELQRIPTSYESAVLARRILALTPLATLSTVFPTTTSSDQEDEASILERRPPGLGGVPIGLMDYIADCDGAGAVGTGNPTILAIGIATTFKNVAAGSNMSISVNWAPPYPPEKRIKSSPSPKRRLGGGSRSSVFSRLRDWWRSEVAGGEDGEEDNTHRDSPHAHKHKHHPKHPKHTSPADPVPYSAANLPRFSLLGYLEPITPSTNSSSSSTSASADDLQSCFLASHPDAKYWLPGNRTHASSWVRMVVTQVYWIGGFGDRAFIGWIPVEEWRNVTRAEWGGVRLPGEEPGWDEWSVVPEVEVEL